MKNTSVRPTDSIEAVMHTYGNMLFRLCLITLGNVSDAEDVVQETIIKYMQKAPKFNNKEHEKAWLIKVATNKCRDILRYKSRYPMVEIDEITAFTKESADNGILDALMMLPERFRVVLVLYYVEEYSIEDIAKFIGKTTSAVKMRLQKGRKLLKETYRKECM